MPQDALTGTGKPHQARALNTLMHGEVSFDFSSSREFRDSRPLLIDNI